MTDLQKSPIPWANHEEVHNAGSISICMLIDFEREKSKVRQSSVTNDTFILHLPVTYEKKTILYSPFVYMYSIIGHVFLKFSRVLFNSERK